MKTFCVIGAGRTGRSVAKLMRRAGWRVGALSCRTMRSARAARRFVGAGKPLVSNDKAVQGADLVILGVPDGLIRPVWLDIAGTLKKGALAIHLCGAESSRILKPARGARTGSIHPMRSFADPALAVRSFKGTFCAVEGPRTLERLVKAWGGVPIRVDPRTKSLYHASAVFASNYLVASIDAAVKLLSRSKVSRKVGIKIALALAGGTLANLKAVGLPDALTGPIDRGDVETVGRHLKGLEMADRRLLELYRELARHTCKVARAKGTPSSRIKRIENLLK
jgi:predicted short-subunit dehydrogenase-like oxidoreductase (DUF2520 family)